jgi:2-methylcitrate dehydratase PrpD
VQDALASHVAAARSAALRPEAAQAAQTFLLDTLCIGVAGANARFRSELLPAVAAWGEGSAAGVLGDGMQLPAASAAFLNCFQMHCLEFDCVHEDAVAHVMTTVAAATLAELEQARDPVAGELLLRALCAGVDVAATLGLAATTPLTFFRPATTGIFGAAAALAVLRDLSDAQVRELFGYCLAQAAGTMQAHEEGKPTLPIQIGHAARNAFTAADMAVSGIPAPAASIDGKHGYLNLFERGHRDDGLATRLALGDRALELSHKPFPSGRATHGGLEAVQLLMGRGLAPDNLSQLSLSAPPLIHQLVIRPATRDMNVNYARLCFPYVAAVMLRRGTVGLTDFSEAALRDPQTLALADRVLATVQEGAAANAFTPQTLTAELAGGERLTVTIDHLLGSPAHPLSRDDALAKARACTQDRYADGAARLDRLVHAVDALPTTADCRGYADSLFGDPA